MRKSENKFERERLANNKKKGKKDNNTEEEQKWELYFIPMIGLISFTIS